MAYTLRPSIKYELEQIYSDPYIINSVSTDNFTPEPIGHGCVNYFSCFDGIEFCGCYLLIRQTVHEIELHALLNKKGMRKSREFGRLILDQCFSDERIFRVTGLIHSHMRKVVNYALKFGFKIEGFKRMTETKNSLPVGTYILGLTRGDYGRRS